MTRCLAVLRLLVYLAIDTVHSSLVLAWDVLTPKDYSAIRILRYATRAESEWELLALSCAITMTPGTLTLDIADDRRTLLIHAMYAADPERLQAAIRERYETNILLLLRGRLP
ncbi:MAG: Na+/H+ antiporter subunit E [Planctomycetota bacterium]|nr:Na+/H+ antiporter subunit E [Planctomycetota bacterium]MCX8039956.1 Na+/H+ antiporter subunit E [Planctomycetota bacterium]MDW8372973.1 Na+/H+ antiporter subunit E [Planctomycetota bacterium]